MKQYGFGVVVILLAITTNYLFGWDLIEAWTYIIGLLLIAFGYIYFVVKREEFSPRVLYEEAVKRKKAQLYQEYGVNLDELEINEDGKL